MVGQTVRAKAKDAPAKKKKKPAKKPTRRRLAEGTVALIVTSAVSLLGHGATLGVAAIAQSGKQSESIVCHVEVEKAIELQKANPTVEIPYSGAVEEKCNISEKTKPFRR